MVKPYTGAEDETCPYRGGKLCKKVCPTCKFQQQYVGVNPLTNEPMNVWECSHVMSVILQMENSKNLFRVGSAIESFRNETVDQHKALLSGTVKIAEKVIEGAGRITTSNIKQLGPSDREPA